MGMGKSPPNPYLEPMTDDNLTMIADMFEAMRKVGRDPDMPISEIADIGLQLIAMIRERDVRIEELRAMHNSLLSKSVAAWDPSASEWVVGPGYSDYGNPYGRAKT
jgi:hypothetical protein